jgi:hypothetical protein
MKTKIVAVALKKAIAAFGNPNGDLQMLQWTSANKG